MPTQKHPERYTCRDIDHKARILRSAKSIELPKDDSGPCERALVAFLRAFNGTVYEDRVRAEYERVSRFDPQYDEEVRKASAEVGLSEREWVCRETFTELRRYIGRQGFATLSGEGESARLEIYSPMPLSRIALLSRLLRRFPSAVERFTDAATMAAAERKAGNQWGEFQRLVYVPAHEALKISRGYWDELCNLIIGHLPELDTKCPILRRRNAWRHPQPDEIFPTDAYLAELDSVEALALRKDWEVTEGTPSSKCDAYYLRITTAAEVMECSPDTIRKRLEKIGAITRQSPKRKNAFEAQIDDIIRAFQDDASWQRQITKLVSYLNTLK